MARRRKQNTSEYTHQTLNPRFRQIGRDIAARKSGDGSLHVVTQDDPEHRGLSIWDVRSRRARNFEASYRRAWPRQDELISTSSVREIIIGFIQHDSDKNVDRGKIDEMQSVLDAVSRVRLPTRMVGYSLGGADRMQHPTKKGTGLFAESAKTMKSHAFHDIKRKAEVLNAMEGVVLKDKDGWTVKDVVHAGIRAAIVYTLNEMAAPPTAVNVKQHSLVASQSDATLRRYLILRERMKDIFEELGGDVMSDVESEKTDEDRWRREWGSFSAARAPTPERAAAGRRSVSPRRLPRSTSAATSSATTLLGVDPTRSAMTLD